MEKPAYWSINKVFIDGQPQKRLMIVFKTPPCQRILANKRCFICGFDSHCRGASQFNLTLQYKCLKKNIEEEKVEHLDFLSSGSLLDSRQIDYQQVLELIEEIKKNIFLKSVLIEGRIEHCDIYKLQGIKEMLGRIKLEYGVGLESYSDTIRNKILKKGLKLKEYIEIVKKLAVLDIGVCTYILAGVPKLPLKKSLEETERSILKVIDLYKRFNCRGRIALFPIFIAPNTELESLYNQGEYKLMSLEEIITILLRLKERIEFEKWPVFVGLDDEGISNNRYSSFNLPKKIVGLIEEFNFAQDVSVLKNYEN